MCKVRLAGPCLYLGNLLEEGLHGLFCRCLRRLYLPHLHVPVGIANLHVECSTLLPFAALQHTSFA